MPDKLRWGIIGTGNIARKLADALASSATGDLVAVGSRRQATADAFGADYGGLRCYATYDSLLADPEVDVVYNSLPNHLHLEWTAKAAAAGKHILCEKPLAVNQREAEELIAAVREYDVFMLEAFMYRCHPQTAKLVELIAAGAIGEVRLIQAHFSYNMGQQLDNIRLQHGAAGGGIMDVGCYTVSMSRLLAGAALGLTGPAEPEVVHGVGHIGADSRVDEWSTAVLRFPDDIVANVSCGTQVAVDNTLRIWGSDGHIMVPNPWFPGETNETATILVNRGGDSETVCAPGPAPLYTIEVDTVAAHLADRQAPAPCMTWDDSIGNMRTLDRWRVGVGLRFENE
jgi:predicted dehydrogenase